MSTARHIIALLKSYVEGQEQQFHSAALQIAAHEARLGHGKLAKEIKDLIDQSKSNRTSIDRKGSPVPLAQPKGELAELLAASYPKTKLSDMVLSPEVESRLKRILLEQKQKNRLSEYNLSARRKILLVGPPGTGKTMTASALAGELQLPLFSVIHSSLIGKFMGETASRLRLIFKAMLDTRGVYFFDEFDAIGTQRSSSNDVGEIRRVLNSFLLFIENDEIESLIIAATNHPNLLDEALFRRFDDVIEYGLPSEKLIRRFIKTRLSMFETHWDSWDTVTAAARGLSTAEIARATEEAAKHTVLCHSQKISQQDIISALRERKEIASQRINKL